MIIYYLDLIAKLFSNAERNYCRFTGKGLKIHNKLSEWEDNFAILWKNDALDDDLKQKIEKEK